MDTWLIQAKGFVVWWITSTKRMLKPKNIFYQPSNLLRKFGNSTSESTPQKGPVTTVANIYDKQQKKQKNSKMDHT